MYSWLFLTDTEYIPLISLPAFYFLCKDQLRMTAFKNHKYNHASVLDHFSCILCSVTPWTRAHQAPLSMEFSRQEYWSRLLCPPPGDLPDPGIEPDFLRLPAQAGRFFTTSATWEAHSNTKINYFQNTGIHSTNIKT